MASKKPSKRQTLKTLPNRVRVTGFNAQAPSYPELPENSVKWSRNIRWESALRNEWALQQTRAKWFGAALAAIMVIASIGILYTLGS
jgi:hypothetical protein